MLVVEYCSKCHGLLSFKEMLKTSLLLNVHMENGKVQMSSRTHEMYWAFSSNIFLKSETSALCRAKISHFQKDISLFQEVLHKLQNCRACFTSSDAHVGIVHLLQRCGTKSAA